MKMLEWLGNPKPIKDVYCDKNFYFKPNYAAFNFGVDAYGVFSGLARRITESSKPDPQKPGHVLYESKFPRYDAWQMFKHTLAIYNYTSFVTQTAINLFGNSDNKSIAGRFNRIILSNVVNEFPSEYIEDENIRTKYKEALKQEHEQAEQFIDIMADPQYGIPKLFDNNCNAGFEIKYITAKQFAVSLDMPQTKREYLKRYFA